MSEPLKRISLMIGERQHRKITGKGLNTSGFIRDLIDDHFSEHKVTISVSKEGAELYQRIISNPGATDMDVEPYFNECLKKLLKDRIKKMEALQKEVS